MRKDKTRSVRVNSEIDQKIQAEGMTLQLIIDLWIDANFDIEEKTTLKIKKKAS